MHADRICKECGRKIPADASQEFCPHCLLSLGLEPGQPDAEHEPPARDEPARSGRPKGPAGETPPGASPGSHVASSPVGTAARRHGNYELIEERARGGMGIVYKARHRQLDRIVALKLVAPGASVARFLREAKLLARVSSPCVVTAHDFEVQADGHLLLAMEWVEGRDLAQVLREENGPLNEETVLPWMAQVAEGMRAVAEAGIIHRDLKPSNILIDPRGMARVADFGLARGPIDLGDLTVSDHLMGSPHYMAPEQAESPRNADTRADIYSFGATFYHALTGTAPFAGESAFAVLLKHKTEPLIAPQARNNRLSDRISALLERCLAKSPAQRFASFEEVLAHLQAPSRLLSPWEDASDVELGRYLAQYQTRRRVYLEQARSLQTPDKYEFAPGRTLRILYGNIVDQAVDAIVSSDGEYLPMAAGVSKAIRAAAGSILMAQETRKFVPVRPGRVVVTSAGGLNARFVFHGVTLAVFSGPTLWPSRDLILEILGSCVYHAETLYVQSMALPLLGTGFGGLSREVCLDAMFRFLAGTLLRGLTPLQDVRVVLA